MRQTGSARGNCCVTQSSPLVLGDEDEDDGRLSEPLDLTGKKCQHGNDCITTKSQSSSVKENDVFPLPLLPLAACSSYHPTPAHLLAKSTLREDVWDGEPSLFSDDEENNFLGFRVIPGVNGHLDFSGCCRCASEKEAKSEESQEDSLSAGHSHKSKKSSQNKKKKKSKKKSKYRTHLGYKKKKKSKSKAKSKGAKNNNSAKKTGVQDEEEPVADLNGSVDLQTPSSVNSCSEEKNTSSSMEDVLSQVNHISKSSAEQPSDIDPPSPADTIINDELPPLLEVEAELPSTPKKKKKRDFFSPAPYKRGSNGWEDCLRPRPTQANYFQSLVMLRKRTTSPPRDHRRPKDAKRTKSDPDESSSSGSTVSSSAAKTSSSSSVQRNNNNNNNAKHKNSSLRNRKHSSSTKEKQEQLSDQTDSGNNKGFDVTDMCDQGSDSEGGNKLLDAAVGEIVWAKLGSTRWWPAIVIWGADCGQPPARPGQTWVFWFGDHKISELPRDKLIDFVADFKNKYTEFAGKLFKRGVVEAIREVAVRAEKNVPNGDSSVLLSWAKGGFLTDSKKPNPYAPDPDMPIPEGVRRHVNRIKAQYLQALQSLENQGNSQSRVSRFDQLENKDSALKKVREGQLKIQDVCIACDSSAVEIVKQHPLIEGGLCKHCKDDIVETMFAYGDDGTNAYCVICGQAGELLICDNNDCNRCYCTGCIDVLVAPGAHQKVLETSPWLCYVCSDYDPERNGLIRKKDDWQQNVMQFFQPERHMPLPPSLDEYKEKKPIRVLSLFDGIGTGIYVLEQLGIEVEAYFASEIDQDAVNVSIVQHKNNVTHMGPIEVITDSEVAKLCPIDLVIGGSPCNDLSLVNPARKGLYDPTGTGKLFFDFFRVLKAVQLANKGRHVFWLFENVASMPQEYKSIITRFLQCEPAMIDSKYFSPQNRARYFWGNIPGMYTLEEFWNGGQMIMTKPLQPHLLQQNITLDSVLTPNLNRKAMVEKIRTVTTRSNSLRQGKMSILPVTMNGEADVLWVTELEEVFGFPRHYTDAGNIPLGRRQQLLGKAWSVPVIKHLFTPLRNFFKTVPTSSTTTVPTSTPAAAAMAVATTTAAAATTTTTVTITAAAPASSPSASTSTSPSIATSVESS